VRIHPVAETRKTQDEILFYMEDLHSEAYFLLLNHCHVRGVGRPIRARTQRLAGDR
jgi:hypothetical protein